LPDFIACEHRVYKGSSPFYLLKGYILNSKLVMYYMLSFICFAWMIFFEYFRVEGKA
jgi:hypothetical protein